ncbi:amidohydrolase family protein [Cellulosilyticum sp. I15G10I2]|uniref:amidohydrolase family protein n=1 Tax=Cellulosilyticum sp. I15G10I2 TaxID=1892843 RepID=UPI00085C0CA2|nr:amidohydrolase family protein [Cellulosilyticum sp. I15G10I2]
MDFGILDGSIYSEGEIITGNLYIKNGKIDTISPSYLACKETYDAKGKLVLPGFIDPHVHFQLTVGENTSADDFYTGSIKAALGGITTFIDFLDPIKTTTELSKAFDLRREQAKKSVIDYGFHTTIAQPIENASVMMKASLQKGIPTLKLFTTYASSERRTEDRYIDELLKHSKELQTRILIHAENDSMILEGKGIEVSEHEWARPALAERTEVLKLAEMTKYRDGLLYIVHLSAGSTARRFRENYHELLHKNIILESCPHYFLWDDSVYKEKQGYLWTMTPPLRSKEEKEILHQEIGQIDIIATDHCPFESVLKNKIYTSEIPMGVGGVQYAFGVMYALYGPSIIPKFTENPARVHGLYPQKGTLMPGADADIVIFEDGPIYSLEEEGNIYHHTQVKGKIKAVFSRGRMIVENGEFKGNQGTYVERRLNE